MGLGLIPRNSASSVSIAEHHISTSWMVSFSNKSTLILTHTLASRLMKTWLGKNILVGSQKKASSSLGLIRRNLQVCPLECRKMAYVSLVQSLMEYYATVSVWDPPLQKDFDKLEGIQRQGAWFIKKDYFSWEPGCVTTMLSELVLQPLQECRNQTATALLVQGSHWTVPSDTSRGLHHTFQKEEAY